MDEANPYLTVPGVGRWADFEGSTNCDLHGEVIVFPSKKIIDPIILGISLEYRREINENPPKCRRFPDQKTKIQSIKALPGSRLLRQPRQLRLLSVLFQLWKPSGAKKDSSLILK